MQKKSGIYVANELLEIWVWFCSNQSLYLFKKRTNYKALIFSTVYDKIFYC